MFKNLINWSLKEFSHLPWRKERSLYKTLVSEIMLQQTTVSTVVNHFDRFLKEFPTLKKLSEASEEEICIAWKGLGYYRRARNLRKACIYIQENYRGKIPLEKNLLLEIPGIGDYTASALISIGSDEEEWAIDANLERVLARFFGINEKKGKKLHLRIREEIKIKSTKLELDKISYRFLNESLMDLGRVYCQARKAECLLCPLKSNCVAYKNKKPLSYPEEVLIDKKKSVQKKYFELDLLRIVVLKKDQVLGYYKSESQWLSGQVEIPTFVLRSEDVSLNQYPFIRKEFKHKIEKNIKTAITKYKIKNYIISMSYSEFDKFLKTYKAQTNIKDYKYFILSGRETNYSTTTLKVLTKEGIKLL